MNAFATAQLRHRNFPAHPFHHRCGSSLRSEIFCGWPVWPGGSERVPYPPNGLCVLDDSAFVETAWVGSFSSSYMFTLSGPATGRRIRLPPPHPVRPNPGRPGPRGSGSLIPVGGELDLETVA